MKNRALFSTLLLAAAMLVLAGCDPTSLNTEERGRQVKFSAAASLTPVTKTTYGSVVSGCQMINWVSNTDVIRIYSPDALVENAGSGTGTATPWKPTDPAFGLKYWYADYTINTVSTVDGHKSLATLKNVGENGLTWSGSSAAVFYGAYPNTTIATSTSGSTPKLRFAPFVSGGNGDSTPGIQDGTTAKVAQMPLLAMKTVPAGSDVVLDFYPAFSAFEFHLKSKTEALTVQSVELSIDPAYTGTDMYLTGYCYYDLNSVTPDASDSYDSHYLPNNKLSFENGGKSIKINLGDAPISSTTEASFTIFTLPCTLDHLCFRVNFTHDGASYTKMLRMTQNSGWVSFPAGHKAVITGLAVDPDLWTFKTITLKGEALEWEVKGISTSSDKSPQASQFVVSGANVKNVYDNLHHTDEGKKYRQYWVLPTTETTAKVTFDIMSPFGGTYTVTPAGSVDDFEIKYYTETKVDGHTVLVELTGEHPNQGAIGRTEGTKKFPTKVIFTVTPKSTAFATSKLWFNVTVKASDADGGEVYNIDSETQLYDMRGYHYFVTKDPLE